MSQASFSFLSMPPAFGNHHGDSVMGSPFNSYESSSLFSANDFFYPKKQQQHQKQPQQQHVANNAVLMGQLLNLMQEPQTAQMVQQILQQHQQQDAMLSAAAHNLAHNKPPSPKLLPLIQQSHMERASSPDNSFDAKSSSSHEDDDDHHGSPKRNSYMSYSDHDDHVIDEVVTYVPGTWKSCTFNHSQLLREFAVIPRKLIKKLVSMSEKENWGNNNEVLLSYLNYTFRRLIDEKKIVAYFADQPQNGGNNANNTSKKNPLSQPMDKVQAPTALCFNTGLLTTGFERIFCFLAPNKNQREIFQQNSHKKFVEWFVTLFVKESDILKHEGNIIRSKLGVAPIPADFLPHRTSYFSEKDKTVAKEIVWNVHTAMENVSYVDMIKNMRQNDHLGFMVQNTKDEELSLALKSGLTLALKRAECNPRIAVPQYYWDKNATIGELQLLLPLDLDTLGIKCAATVRIGPSGKYEIRTVLSLNQAYTNARLIQKIDQSWLMKAF